MKINPRQIVAVTLILLASGAATVAAPPQIRYQGAISDDAGVPLSGSVNLVFGIHDAESAGSVLWTESRPGIPLTPSGIVDILLGQTTPLPSSVFDAADRWLEVTVNGMILQPRQKLASVPFAHSADRLGDQQLADVLTRGNHTGALDPAVIGPQGAGSGLDADFLDGKQRSEFEVRVLASWNVASPANALAALTSGLENTAFGDQALNANTTGGFNTAVGFFALKSNVEGIQNTAVGHQALVSATGGQNTAVGYLAGAGLTGMSNSAFGVNAMRDTLGGSFNTVVGSSAFRHNTTGAYNAALGFSALINNLTGSGNTALGATSLAAVDGSNNTAVGYRTLVAIDGGNENIALGRAAGESILGSPDSTIMIGNTGQSGDTLTIRIGSIQTRTFIAGIRGTTTDVDDAITVVIDGNGQLGTISSSRHHKRGIQDIGDGSDRLHALRPVSFQYKDVQQEENRPVEFGLIAEEVAQVFPERVVLDSDGAPATVKYRLLSSLLLNEVQQQRREIDDLRDALASLSAEVAAILATDQSGG